MSQTKIPKLRVFTKPNTEGVSHGANTVVEIDGKRLPISFLKIECKSKAITKVMMEMYVQLDIELDNVEAEVKEIPLYNSQKQQFIKERTKIISKMLDNPGECGIFKTTEAFAELDDLFDKFTGSDRLSGAQELRNNQPNQALPEEIDYKFIASEIVRSMTKLDLTEEQNKRLKLNAQEIMATKLNRSEKSRPIPVSGIFIDTGFTTPTIMTIIKNDCHTDTITLDSRTEFEDIAKRAVDLAVGYKIDKEDVKAPGYPALEKMIKTELGYRKYMC